MAREKITRRIHLLQILVAIYVPDAGCSAELEIRVEAMLVIRLVWRERPASSQIELATHQGKRSTNRAGIGEGAKVTSPVLLLHPSERESRDRVVQIHFQEEKVLVVAKTNIVSRMEILDQLSFKKHGFRLAAHDVNVEVVNSIDQGIKLQIPAHASRRMEVLTHALAQVSRLPHVNHGPEPILHQVDAGLVGHLAQLAANMIGRGHWNCGG